MSDVRVIEPMLAKPADPTQIDEILDDSRWILEPKVDGRRLVLTLATDETGACSVTASGRDSVITYAPRPVLDALTGVHADLTLDGELVGDTYMVFDLPRAGEMVTPGTLYAYRREALEALFAAWNPGPHIRLMPAAFTPGEKLDMVDRVIAGRGEGVVAKQDDSVYEPGHRSKAWRKIKRTHTIDCVVLSLGVEKANMIVGVHRGNQMLEFEVGRLVGDGPIAKPGDVIEVRTLYVTDDDRLYQPCVLKIRTDKAPEECTAAQLDLCRTDKNLILNWGTL